MDIEDLATCEQCGAEAEKPDEIDGYPPRYCHGCYVDTAGKLASLRRQLAAAMPVLRAAEEWLPAKCAYVTRCKELKTAGIGETEEAQTEIAHLSDDAGMAEYRLTRAVRQYRERREGER